MTPAGRTPARGRRIGERGKARPPDVEDEIGTVRTLTVYRSIMRHTITGFHGRVVDSPGDNVLAEFGSVVDAVSSTVEIQRQSASATRRFLSDAVKNFESA